jgi:hypothetical protein
METTFTCSCGQVHTLTIISQDTTNSDLDKLIAWFRQKTTIVYPIPTNDGNKTRGRLQQLIDIYGVNKLIESGDGFIESAWERGTKVANIKYLISCWDATERKQVAVKEVKAVEDIKQLEKELATAESYLANLEVYEGDQHKIMLQRQRVEELRAKISDLPF